MGRSTRWASITPSTTRSNGAIAGKEHWFDRPSHRRSQRQLPSFHRSTAVNGHIGLIHSILPATVDLHVTIPDSHPSTRNLGSERVGSGTIVDPDGYILTVHYVTVGASAITVTLFEGEQYPGKIAAEDQETGLALVKIQARELPFLKLAPSDSTTLGQPVVMIASSGQTG